MSETTAEKSATSTSFTDPCSTVCFLIVRATQIGINVFFGRHWRDSLLKALQLMNHSLNLLPLLLRVFHATPQKINTRAQILLSVLLVHVTNGELSNNRG